MRSESRAAKRRKVTEDKRASDDLEGIGVKTLRSGSATQAGAPDRPPRSDSTSASTDVQKMLTNKFLVDREQDRVEFAAQCAHDSVIDVWESQNATLRSQYEMELMARKSEIDELTNTVNLNVSLIAVYEGKDRIELLAAIKDATSKLAVLKSKPAPIVPIFQPRPQRPAIAIPVAARLLTPPALILPSLPVLASFDHGRAAGAAAAPFAAAAIVAAERAASHGGLRLSPAAAPAAAAAAAAATVPMPPVSVKPIATLAKQVQKAPPLAPNGLAALRTQPSSM